MIIIAVGTSIFIGVIKIVFSDDYALRRMSDSNALLCRCKRHVIIRHDY
jgi:hypothetical protein